MANRATFIIPKVALVATMSGVHMAPTAQAQGPAFGSQKKPAVAATSTANGLESATPTDDVGDLEGGLGSGSFDPSATTKSSNANSDSIFGNGVASPSPNASVTPSSDKSAAAKSASAKSAPAKPASGIQAPTKPPPATPSDAKTAPVKAATPEIPPLAPPNSGAAPTTATPSPGPAPGTPEAAPAAAPANVESTPVAATLPPPNDFAGAPPVPGTMRLMAEGEAPEEYVVQAGDTLFDICGQLLDEPGYWPKLWSLNPEIKNPHFIFPTMKLRFYPGDDEAPPYLQVVSEEDVIPIDKADLDESQLVTERVVFPIQEKAVVPPTEVVGPEGVDALTDAVLTAGGSFQGRDVELNIPGFILPEQKEPVGSVVGGRSGEISMARGAKILVEATGKLEPGTVYTIVRPGDEVENPDTGDTIGNLYFFVAHARVQRSVGEGIFVAIVEDGLLAVRAEDQLIPYLSTKRRIPMEHPDVANRNIDANVVGFDFRGQETGGQGHFVFLDRGTAGGVTPGSYVPLYATPGHLSAAFGESELPIDYEAVGIARILDATDVGAVGYITKSSQEIRLGDRTSKG